MLSKGNVCMNTKSIISKLGTLIKGAFVVSFLTMVLTVVLAVVAVGYLAATNPGAKACEAKVRSGLGWKEKTVLAFTSDCIRSEDKGLFSVVYRETDGHEEPVAYGFAGRIIPVSNK